MTRFRPNDKVVLRFDRGSHSPVMTVHFQRGRLVECGWLEDGQHHQQTYTATSLERWQG